ncbi:hypothetical protein PV325_005124 [Microctonus aethiopoides]|uniref:Centromere/kinetochore protein zw10 n=1 Tax=Microctonus aethiopoides TaxID=144406 RepID=A0AA39KRX8_9HYME|nr:hypothetical protein PV325_005124 [Microctonus aethiopoides]KAK0171356.1 hypothetical protein PV328_009097 [Microctonus aethiopoides]
MSSLVVDVLATTVQMGMADLKVEINTIQKEIIKLKNDVKKFIEDNYIDFLPTLKKDHVLVEKTEKLLDELRALQTNINDQIKVELSGSTKELKNLSEALKESNMSLVLSQQLLELNESLSLVQKYREKCHYIDAAKMLKKIAVLLSKPNGDLQLLNIYEPIKDCYHIAHGSLLKIIYELWDQHVQWKMIDDGRKNTTSLTIEEEMKEVQDLIISLYHLDDLASCMQIFSNKLFKSVVSPIIRSDCSVYVEEQKVFNVITENNKRTDTYKIVLHNLQMLFQFLHQHFNVDIEDKTFIYELNEYLWKSLSDELLENCVSEIIPRSSIELQNFKSIESDIQQFENYLLEIGFIRESEGIFTNYVKNVDKLYVDKLSLNLLMQASELMKKDLNDSFKYESENNIKDFQDDCWHLDPKIEQKLNKNSFKLPSCQISKSAREILQLVENILDEVTLSPESCAPKLFYTSRNIFEEYVWIVPEYHKNFLETIPQQVALFHNNCMYFAHHLMTLPIKYRNKIPNSLQDHNITYVDLTLKLRSIGVEYFHNHVKYQRDIILNILKNSGLTQLGQELSPDIERSLRQCIRQLQLLKTVWLDVLPMNIYCKALGCILNSMIEDIVLKVITVEDISAAAAVELVSLFNMIINRAPSILPEPNSITRYVNKWTKLLELIKILEASLKEIEDRWAGGKGPLAREFTSSQIKQLIRALFQNTERRSMLLTSIK